MLKRVALSLLIAYAATITVVAVCLGGRLHVFRRIYTRFIRGRLSGSPESFEDIQTSTGIGHDMTDGVGRMAIILANINLGQIAAVACLTLLGGLTIAVLRRNPSKALASTLRKD